jgi:basic amino acid/polyamine antiporter, APA family
LRLETLPGAPKGTFKTPYINAKYVLPVLLIAALAASFIYYKEGTINFLKNTPTMYKTGAFIGNLDEKQITSVRATISIADPEGYARADKDLESYLSGLDKTRYAAVITALPVPQDKKYESGFLLFRHKIPQWIFIIIAFVLVWFSVRKNLSLIPVLGLLSCLYMMSQVGVTNWIGFSLWLVIGLTIYFAYSYRNSRLHTAAGGCEQG